MSKFQLITESVIWNLGMTLEDLEKKAILKCYSELRGNKTQTAKVLGISIRTLDAKLDKYDGKPMTNVEDAPKKGKAKNEN